MRKVFIVIFIFIFLLCGCEHNDNSNTDIDQIEKRKIIGVWINYNEIYSLIKECKTQEDFNMKINFVLDKLSKYKINTIFLHCRAFDDCFYKSENYSPSIYCSNEKNELKFDVLDSFLKLSEKYGIEIHAWINPYRIRKDGDTSKLAENKLAGDWYTENPEDKRIIITENSIFYNPASVDVQNYILSGIKEILNDYPVNGIHIDDYFYPTTDEKIDTEFYNDYISNGGKLSLSDFRRENVNNLISSIYLLVKSYSEEIQFTISPSADINADYYSHYADVELWASKKGYTDCIIPQIYYGFEHETMPFNEVLTKWCEIKTDKVEMAIGIPLYKSGQKDIFAESGENEWIEKTNIISGMIKTIDNNKLLNGYVYYSLDYLIYHLNTNLEEEKKNIIL